MENRLDNTEEKVLKSPGCFRAKALLEGGVGVHEKREEEWVLHPLRELITFNFLKVVTLM